MAGRERETETETVSHVVPAEPLAVERAARLLADGHLVAFPTETVYGLGADGLNSAAVTRIFQAKGRPADHPLILHVADVAHARALAREWPSAAEQLAATFWPGPLTFILKRAPRVPDAVTGGQDTVGVRMPAHPIARSLITAFAAIGSGVVAAPSANRFGSISPTRARDVAHSLAGRWGEHDMILDGGECSVGVELTIVDLSSGAPRILRPGGVGRDAIEQALGRPLEDSDAPAPRVSGALESHYAPQATTMLVSTAQMVTRLQQVRARDRCASADVACLVMDPVLRDQLATMPHVVVMPMSPSADGYARELYARLHDADQQGVVAILVEAPPTTMAWEAVNDRLKRATA